MSDRVLKSPRPCVRDRMSDANGPCTIAELRLRYNNVAVSPRKEQKTTNRCRCCHGVVGSSRGSRFGTPAALQQWAQGHHRMHAIICKRMCRSETVSPRPCVRDRVSETVCPRPCVRDRVCPRPCVRDRVSETVCPRQRVHRPCMIVRIRDGTLKCDSGATAPLQWMHAILWLKSLGVLIEAPGKDNQPTGCIAFVLGTRCSKICRCRQ